MVSTHLDILAKLKEFFLKEFTINFFLFLLLILFIKNKNQK